MQGGGPQLNDALSGQFEVLSTNVAAQQLQYIEAGRLQALAVGAPARLEALPAGADAGGAGLRAGQPRVALRHLRAGTHAGRRWCSGSMRRSTARWQARAARAACARRYNLPAVGSVEAFAREIALDRQRNRALVAGHAALFD